MRSVAAALPVLLLAGCGDRSPVGEDRGVTTNQIERLSTPREPAPDPLANVRLQPLTRGDVGGDSAAGGCAFVRGSGVLLLARAGDAVVRIGGHAVHAAASGPVGPTGGFFATPRVGVSVGRDEGGGRITATDRHSGAQLELEGIWTCR
jgi:hypothetical protein